MAINSFRRCALKAERQENENTVLVTCCLQGDGTLDFSSKRPHSPHQFGDTPPKRSKEHVVSSTNIYIYIYTVEATMRILGHGTVYTVCEGCAWQAEPSMQRRASGELSDMHDSPMPITSLGQPAKNAIRLQLSSIK